jgi:DNA modification methylase
VLSTLAKLPDESVNCCVTSPPYWGLRDYGVAGQIGLERTPEEYVAKMVAVFREVRRVLRKDGTCWVNLGDSYCMSTRGAGGAGKQHTNAGSIMRDRRAIVPRGHKAKDLVGIPWRVAFALQSDGWYLRSDIIWSKPNPMPESVTDRPTKAHEYLFLLTKSPRYFYDADAVREPGSENSHGGTPIEGGAKQQALRQQVGGRMGIPAGSNGRNRRSVWNITTRPFRGAHFAVMPPKLVEPCILAGCPKGGVVLDPFTGAGTTAVVALEHGRNFVGCELNPEYVAIARKRIESSCPLLTTSAHADAPLYQSA